MIKEEIKCYGEISFKLIINPKNIGITEDVFDLDGRIGLVRIVYKQKHSNLYSFNHIKIGNDKLTEKILNYSPILDAYGGLAYIFNYPFSFEFKKGDKFELSADDEIENVELFMANKINVSRNLIPN